MLDAAEELAVEGGVKAVTIRAVSERAGISNGAIYHAFGSRGGLVGRAWVRAARRFLALQKQAVDSEDGPVRAVIAAADAPTVFSEQYPTSTRLVFGTRREELIGDAPTEVQAGSSARHRRSRPAGRLFDRRVVQRTRIGRRDRGHRRRTPTGLMLQAHAAQQRYAPPPCGRRGSNPVRQVRRQHPVRRERCPHTSKSSMR
jgi:AcrR family transcriptional regulator